VGQLFWWWVERCVKGEEGRVGEVERRGVCTTEELLCQRTRYQQLVKS
jgi:hypothetical protein